MRAQRTEMHTLDVIDSALQWETERQNRLHQQALEEKKKHAGEGVPEVPAYATDVAGDGSATKFSDRVSRVPEIRSALMPSDEGTEDPHAGEIWSKPFALTKADFEPWTSFLVGYNQSRLFLRSAADATAVRDPSQVDHAVRALFALKKAPLRFVFDPPVQISRQVEYQDFDADLRAAGGQLRPDMMLKLAHELHQKQLAKAIEAGRRMGDELYEAMMGEGHVNLTRAWERVHGRMPSVEELHIMLSTGKIKPGQPSSMQRLEERGTEDRAKDKGTPARELPPAPTAPVYQAPPKAMGRPPVLPDEDDQADAFVVLGGSAATSPRRQQSPAAVSAEGAPQTRRRIGWYLLHAVAASSSAAALVWFWVG